MRERWKPIPGYEDCYAVSDRGRVKRIAHVGYWTKRPPKLLAPRPNKYGYIKFHLCKDGVRKDSVAHRLVWLAFCGPIPRHLQINHLNGDKSDNRLCNLEVCTQSQNAAYSFRVLGRPAPSGGSLVGSQRPSAKLKEADIPRIIALYRTGKYRQKDIGKMYGVSQRMISLITRREYWRHVQVEANPQHSQKML